MDKLLHLNLKKVCRLCLSVTHEAYSIFDQVQTETFKLNIQQLLIKIVDIKLLDVEELPNIVCQKCLQFLVEISKFLQLCLNSDRVIQSYYSQLSDLKLQENVVTLSVKEELYHDENPDDRADDDLNEDLNNKESNTDEDQNHLEIIKEKSEKYLMYYLKTLECREKEYVCNLCSSHFKYSSDFKKHIVTHGEKPYVCSSCKNSYKDYLHLCLHLKKSHIGKIKNAKPEKVFKTIATTLKYYLQLQECGREELVCNLCSKHFTESNDFKNHLSMHGKLPYVCSECKKRFSVYNDLVYHLKEHLNLTGDQIQSEDDIRKTKKLCPYYLETLENGQQRYACNLCEGRFNRLKELNRHLPSHGDKPYNCNDCKKGFGTYSLLTLHIRRHDSSVGYNCDLCDKRYREKSSLIIHKRTHRGEKPYLCSSCGKSFTSITELKIHLRTHSEERKHMCTYCGARFKSAGSLVRHIRSHTGETPYKCSECHKEFSTAFKLKRHKITHTSLKPFVCNICQKAFNRNSNLQTHIKSHSDFRPHMCEVCFKGFTQAHSLRTHMLIHTKEATNAICLVK